MSEGAGVAAADVDKKWWYNNATGEVEYGRKSLSMHRDGPYDTEEQARRAPEIARERAAQWAQEDARENRGTDSVDGD